MATQQDLQQLSQLNFSFSSEHPLKVKIQEEPYQRSGKMSSQKEKQRDETHQIKINHYPDDDNKSVFSNFSTRSKRAPNIEDLCKSIEILRSKFAQRSLQQIIIRLFQAMQLKKQIDGDLKMGLINIENRSEVSRGHDFDESQSLLNGFISNRRDQSREINYQNPHSNEIQKPNTDHQQNLQQKQQHISGESEEAHDKQTKQNLQLKYLEPNIKNIRMRFPQKAGILEQGVNYIYRPKGREVTVRYEKKKTQKTKFINYEEEKRYHDQRIVAKSFVQRGHGITECRKQIEAQGVKLLMHRDTYRGFASSTIIFAFRKLQSFIAIECGKTIKFLDKSQMQSIYTTLLNCRTNLEPELVVTLFKFIRAGFGLNDVDIGEIQSVKLYLACQKFLYGKHVTMEFLQRLGKIQRKKDIQQTLQFLNRKKLKKQQMLAKLRETWKQGKQQRKIHSRDMLKSGSSMTPESSIKLEEDKSNSTNQASKSRYSKKLKKYALQQDQTEVKKQEQISDDNLDMQITLSYVKTQNLDDCFKLLLQSHSEIRQWNEKLFQRRFEKIIQKAVGKLKAEIEIKVQQLDQYSLIKHIGSRHLSQLVYSPFTLTIRTKLLTYLANVQPNPNEFKSLIDQLNAFLIQYEEMNQSVASTFKTDQLIDLSVQNFDIDMDKKQGSDMEASDYAIGKMEANESSINRFQYGQMSEFTDMQLQNIKQEFLDSNLGDFSFQDMDKDLNQRLSDKNYDFNILSDVSSVKEVEKPERRKWRNLMTKMVEMTDQ